MVAIEGNIVADYMVENTRIRISDAYINNNQEDIERILERIQAIGWKIVEAARKQGKAV